MSEVRWHGLEEFKAALRALPAEAAGEGRRIVEGTANAAIVDIRAGYPPGELRNKLSHNTVASGPYGIRIEVKNSSGWAWMWDYGTVERHSIKRKGKSTGAEWGKTRPPFTFVRAMSQNRARLYEQLKLMVLRLGFTRVSGDG